MKSECQDVSFNFFKSLAPDCLDFDLFVLIYSSFNLYVCIYFSWIALNPGVLSIPEVSRYLNEFCEKIIVLWKDIWKLRKENHGLVSKKL